MGFGSGCRGDIVVFGRWSVLSSMLVHFHHKLQNQKRRANPCILLIPISLFSFLNLSRYLSHFVLTLHYSSLVSVCSTFLFRFRTKSLYLGSFSFSFPFSLSIHRIRYITVPLRVSSSLSPPFPPSLRHFSPPHIFLPRCLWALSAFSACLPPYLYLLHFAILSPSGFDEGGACFVGEATGW